MDQRKRTPSGSRLDAAQLSRETRADSCTLRELPKHSDMCSIT